MFDHGPAMAMHPMNYLTSGALLDTPPEALNGALRVVLDGMESMVYGDATHGMTEEEQAVLRRTGFKLERSAGPIRWLRRPSSTRPLSNGV